MEMTLSTKELLEWLEIEKQIIKSGLKYYYGSDYDYSRGKLEAIEDVICHIMKHVEC